MMRMECLAQKCLPFIIIACIYCHICVGHVIEQNGATVVEFIYPEKLNSHQHKEKENGKNHDKYLTYKIKSKHKHFILDVEKQEPIHAGSIQLITYNDNGTAQITKYVPKDCHYHGKVRDNPDSYVYLSTCNGVTGTINDGEFIYDIEPNDSDGSHKLYPSNHILDKINQQLKNSDTSTDISSITLEDQNHVSNGQSNRRMRRAADNVPELKQFELINVEPQYVPYFTTNKTRYVEMLVSTAPGLYEHYQSKEVILERILNCLGQVDLAYSAINIRVVLVALEIQQGSEKFQRHSDGGNDLGSYKRYINDFIKKSSSFRNIRFDNAQFFSHTGWINSVAGMAYVGAMCGKSSAAVNVWSYSSVTGPSNILGHEFGHNMNFPHDGSQCKCLTPRGCFMGGAKSSRPGFSDCNMKRLAQKEFSCLNDHPIAPLLTRCGNGIKDVGEECDCGTEENCKKNGDQCCQPLSCKLKNHLQCSHFNNPDCCSEKCFYRKQGTLCRNAKENCDVGEYCTGESAECPKDHTMRDGTPCGDSIKLLFGTRIGRILTTTELSHPITGQYFKFTPKKWTKGGYACMKIEMLGCEAVQAANLPTPIKTNDLYYHSAMCVTPAISDCKLIVDNTKIIYKSMPNKYCNYEYMLFTHQTDGTMIHKCSGKKVCPDADGMLILSDACEADKSKFIRTEKHSLKLNDKCWNANDGWPQNGDAVHLTGRCDDSKSNTSRLNMLEKDCVMPYVINLDDNAFSAKSSISGDDPFKARLKDDKQWCPPRSDESWLQINIGKVMMIKSIQIKGSYWYGVTGYHLHYSDDGVMWQAFKEVGAAHWKDDDSMCYRGECSKTYDDQCRELWNSDARKADEECWNELNTKKNGFGTCHPTSNTSCDTQNVFCGQLQCKAYEPKPYYIDYGTSYSTIDVQGKTCSAAVITNSEQVGLGMVENGVKCGDDKICIDQRCKTVSEHGIKTCIVVNGKECNNKGFCRDDGVCHCERNLNPADGCVTELPAVNGGWSKWESWSVCTKGCGGGKTSRYRHCNQPIPKYGGQDCQGNNLETIDCNIKACPVGRSCKSIQLILQTEGRPLYDGIYTIEQKPGFTLNVYCDMTTDGGGWTLIVSSHTNTWTESNVKLRSKDHPSLAHDYSILQYADDIKYCYYIADFDFEYRLDANVRGHWGGIWKAPKTYMINSDNKYQEAVILQKKFGSWDYSKYSVRKRLPYLYKQRLTTSNNPKSDFYGSITDNLEKVIPAYWMSGDKMMRQPEHTWYWIREGNYTYPKSCLDVLFRSLNEKQNYKSGVYKIQVKERILETYCDLDRYGGGWTLVTKSSSSTGWTKETTLERNVNNVDSQDFSIFKFVDEIKHSDPAENSFEYMIEAEGENQNGGIFSLSSDVSLLLCPPKGKLPVLLKKFGNWDVNKENLLKFPIHIASKNGIFLTASSDDTSDIKGTIISSGSGSFMSILKKPKLLKVWVREGGSRRSCNDIKVRGLHKGKADYKNGFYMLGGFQPVYCDMQTTKNEGWTLLVSSINNGWTKDQVLQRNIKHPSIFKDFSMLKLADSIKNISKSTKFKYMLDAKERRHWGGIWEAPIEYSFTQHSTELENVNLITKFGDWEYEASWWSKPRKRMPYLGRPEKGKALLTTASYDDYFEYGSIIANDSDGSLPAKWMYSEMVSPGAIWYWVNENDCGNDYAQVHGGYSEWSRWSRCSSFCGKGKQNRHRLCNSPIARCGGMECDETISSLEERECIGECSISKVMTDDSTYCFQPETGECAPVDNTRIVMRGASKCDGPSSQYVFDAVTGEMTHKCSNKPVCFKEGKTNYRTELVVSSSCPKPTSSLHLKRTIFNSIQFGTLCMDPSGGRNEGSHIILWHGCDAEKRKFEFPNLAAGKVKTSYYANMDSVVKLGEIIDRPDYPNTPTHQGWLDNIDSQRNIGAQYALRMQTLFIAPETGEYVFVAACDDFCKVYLSQTTRPSDRSEIIHVDAAVRYLQWNKNDKQKSKPIQLTVNKEYYFEAILLEKKGADYLSVGVILPDGTNVFPITSDYLKTM